MESRLGAKWLLIAGLVVFVLGAVFFLKLAIDYGWIRPFVQILFGVVLGAAVWGLGIYLEKARQMAQYGHRVSAGGAVILYFSVFAAHFFEVYREDLGMGLEVAAVLLGLIALLLAADAVWRRAQALAAMAVTLIAATTAAAGAWEAFSVLYVTIATAAVVAAAAWRSWPAVTTASLPVAYIALAVHLVAGVDERFVLVAAVVLLALYTLAGLLSRPAADRDGQRALSVLTQSLAWGGGWLLIGFSLEPVVSWDAWGWLALALGVAAAGLASVPKDNAHRWTWGALAYFFLAIWPTAHFDGQELVIVAVWSIEIAVVLALAVRWPHPAIQAAPLPLAFLALMQLVSSIADPLANGELAVLVGTAVFLLPAIPTFLGWLVPLLRHGRTGIVPRFLLGASLVFPLWLLASLVSGPVITLTWAAVAAALLAVGFIASVPDLRIAGLAVFGPVLVRIFTRDMAGVDPIWRVLAFLGVGLILLVVSFAYARNLRQGKKGSGPGERAGPPS